MLKRKFNHPRFGKLSRFLGPWKADFRVPGWEAPVQLVIESKDESRAIELLDMLATVVDSDELFAARIREDLYECYCFFKRLDIEEAGMSPDDFDKFPSVEVIGDVYSACDPYKLRLGESISKELGNLYILFEVEWPNDHLLQLFWQLGDGVFEYKHVDLFG